MTHVVEVDNLTPLRTFLDSTAFFRMNLVQAAPDSGRVDKLMPSDEDMNKNRSAIKARTLLAVAYRNNQLLMVDREVVFYDPTLKENFIYPVKVLYADGDLPMIDWIIQKARMFEGPHDPDKDQRLNRLWNLDENLFFENLYPEVQRDLIKTGAIKCMAAYTPHEEQSWAATRGWLLIFNFDGKKDLPVINRWLSLSDNWLDTPSSSPVKTATRQRQHAIHSPQQKTQFIKEKRKRAQQSFLEIKPLLDQLTTP